MPGWLAVGILWGLTLICCANPLQGTATSTRFYLLEDRPPPAEGTQRQAVSDLLGTLGIGAVGLPEYLKRPQIVTRSGSHQIALSLFDHWGETLEAGVARVLTSALVRHQGLHRMSVQPQANQGQLDYWLWIDINRFDGAPDGELVLAGRWSIRGRDRTAPQGWHAFFLHQQVRGEGIPGLVEAHSMVLERLGAEIAARLDRSLTP